MSAIADDLDALLTVIERRGVRIGGVRMGDLTLTLASPWPPPSEVEVADRAAAQVELAEQAKDPAREKRLVKLRKASKKNFGRVLPDEALLQMEGAL